MRETTISVALLAVVAGLIALQVTTPWEREKRAVPASPVPAKTTPPRLQLGVTTDSLAKNSHRRWRANDLQEVNAFEQAAQRHADVVMWFSDWAHVADFDPRQAAAVAARGSVPEISWEPWDAHAGTRQPRYSLASIIAGRHDRYIRRWAKQIAAYGNPVRLRFAHEMNGRWYPWAERANGNRPGEYVAAWRHVHWIFATAGAGNVTWVWSPVAGRLDRTLYPGKRQVDALAVSGFIAGKGIFRGRWRSFAAAFGETLTDLHALDPRKPVMLSEIGVAGEQSDKAAWISAMFAEIERRPYVDSLIWFDVRKEADWRISSSRRARDAFRAGLSATA
jgi:beta-mannanase